MKNGNKCVSVWICFFLPLVRWFVHSFICRFFRCIMVSVSFRSFVRTMVGGKRMDKNVINLKFPAILFSPAITKAFQFLFSTLNIFRTSTDRWLSHGWNGLDVFTLTYYILYIANFLMHCIPHYAKEYSQLRSFSFNARAIDRIVSAQWLLSNNFSNNEKKSGREGHSKGSAQSRLSMREYWAHAQV